MFTSNDFTKPVVYCAFMIYTVIGFAKCSLGIIIIIVIAVLAAVGLVAVVVLCVYSKFV